MSDASESKAIALFVYDFPHRKSSDFLLELIAAGFRDIVVLAAPRKILQHSDGGSYFSRSLVHPSAPDMRELCARLGVAFHGVEHNDSVRITEIVRDSGCKLGIIGGARIIPSKVIRLFDRGVINFHPGKIPETSGLDAFFYSVKKDVPVGVTTHFIDGRVDAGHQIWFDEVIIGPEDSIEVVIENGYTLQRLALRRLLRIISDNGLIPRQPVDRPRKNEPMTAQQKWDVVSMFPAWRARHFCRQTVSCLFEACASGLPEKAGKIIDSNPSFIEARDGNYWTPLIVASYNQRLPVVEKLLSLGANASAVGRKGTTVLMYAKTKLLNRAGADYRLLDLLIAAGADVSARDVFGKSVMDYVSAAGDEHMARYFLKMQGGA